MRLRSVVCMGMVIGAVLSLPGAVQSQQTEGWPVSLGFEGLYGKVNFADESLLWDEEIVGGALNLGFGWGFALRGYYWEGRGIDSTQAGGVRSYGGELQFDIGLFDHLKPYLVAGVGELKFDDGYEDQLGETPETATTITLGGGIALDVTRWFRVDVGIRDLAFEREGLVQLPESRSKRIDNTQVTAAVTLTLGRKHRTSAQSQRTATVPVTFVPQGAVVSGGQGVSPAAAAVVGAAAAGGVADPQVKAALHAAGIDTTGIRTDYAATAVEDILDAEVGYVDAKFPAYAPIGQERIPISGERGDTLALRMQWRMHEAFDYVVAQNVEALLQELNEGLETRNVSSDTRRDIMDDARKILAARLGQVQEETELAIPENLRQTEEERERRAKRRRLAFELGGSFGESAAQFVLGGQVGLAAPWSSSMAIVPEVQVGMFDGGSSLLAQGALRYVWDRDGVEPFLGAGIGLLVFGNQVGDRESGSRLVVNPVVGVEIPIEAFSRWFGSSARGLFMEYQGVDFFSIHRVMAGINWSY